MSRPAGFSPSPHAPRRRPSGVRRRVRDWQAALATFEELDRARADGRDLHYVNELGTSARADDLETLTALAAANGLELERRYGVRIAVDADERDRAHRLIRVSWLPFSASRSASAPPTRTDSWAEQHRPVNSVVERARQRPGRQAGSFLSVDSGGRRGVQGDGVTEPFELVRPGGGCGLRRRGGRASPGRGRGRARHV